MKTTVRVDGLKELDAALGELTKATARNILRRVGLKALEPVAETARSLAPDDPDTGGFDLRNSIVVSQHLSRRQKKLAKKEVRSGAAEASFAEVYAGAGPLPQAHNQEFGNVVHGPQPFMRPAWENNKGKVLDTVKSELATEIDKAAQRAARKAARLAKKG